MPTAVLTRVFPYPPAYRAQTRWNPLLAVVAAVIIYVLAAGLGGLALAIAGRPDDTSGLIRIELLIQMVMIGLTFLAAGMFDSRRNDALALRAPANGWRDVLGGAAVIAIVSGSYSLLALMLFRDDLMGDLRPFWGIMQSQWWWALALVAVVGAPLSEELLFRGFLQSALARTRLGFANAALITTAAWTMLHASYSIVGLGEVFLVGLVLSWLLWQTGSLWVPIISHGIYNCVIVSYMAVFPPPV